MLPVIDETALRAAISPDIAVETIRAAFTADGEGRTVVPAVINLDVPSPKGEFHVKTAFIEGVPYVAVKVASGFYDNPSKGLPSGSGLMAIFDAATGLPVALLLDNGFLTDIRTGAAGAVAADLLASSHVEVVGVIGSGVQARHQVQCLRVVRSISRVVAWSPDSEHVRAYCDDLRRAGVEAVAAPSIEAVCREADLLVTTTPSRRAIVEANWLHAGQHITAVGSDSPGKQELAADCLDRADLVIVDRLRQCAAFGELKHAIDAGLLTVNTIHGELGRVAAGLLPGRANASQITIADLTGVGFQDTAIASRAIELLGIARPSMV
jgi:ornithine cyclodeaminase